MDKYNSPYTFLKAPNITTAYECTRTRKSICGCSEYEQFKVEPTRNYIGAQGPKTGPLWSTPQ